MRTKLRSLGSRDFSGWNSELCLEIQSSLVHQYRLLLTKKLSGTQKTILCVLQCPPGTSRLYLRAKLYPVTLCLREPYITPKLGAPAWSYAPAQNSEGLYHIRQLSEQHTFKIEIKCLFISVVSTGTEFFQNGKKNTNHNKINHFSNWSIGFFFLGHRLLVNWLVFIKNSTLSTSNIWRT